MWQIIILSPINSKKSSLISSSFGALSNSFWLKFLQSEKISDGTLCLFFISVSKVDILLSLFIFTAPISSISLFIGFNPLVSISKNTTSFIILIISILSPPF